jgi:hypothetical protein
MEVSEMDIDKKNLKIWVMYLYTVLIVIVGFALLVKSISGG